MHGKGKERRRGEKKTLEIESKNFNICVWQIREADKGKKNSTPLLSIPAKLE